MKTACLIAVEFSLRAANHPSLSHRRMVSGLPPPPPPLSTIGLLPPLVSKYIDDAKSKIEPLMTAKNLLSEAEMEKLNQRDSESYPLSKSLGGGWEGGGNWVTRSWYLKP